MKTGWKFKWSNLLLLKAGLNGVHGTPTLQVITLHHCLVFALGKKNKIWGEERSDKLKPLGNNRKQEVNHWSEELEGISTKVLWLQQHIVSPGQAWRMFMSTPLEVLGHLGKKNKRHEGIFPSSGCSLPYINMWFVEWSDYWSDSVNVMWSVR